jgi:uncharacterized protein YijF (DUF1287 family)
MIPECGSLLPLSFPVWYSNYPMRRCGLPQRPKDSPFELKGPLKPVRIRSAMKIFAPPASLLFCCLYFSVVTLAQQEQEAAIADKPAIERESTRVGDSEKEPASFPCRLSAAAIKRIAQRVRYDPAYVVLEYPGGDVPAGTGVCTDVVIRSYRALGFDLQKFVHEDMKASFSAYPKNWGLSRADKNIDHRRVPNLQKFFQRKGASLKISDKAEDYLPGDLIAWDLNGKNLWHIGVVVAAPADLDQSKVWFVHNIGGGPILDNDPLQWSIVGHYRWHPEK